MPIYNHGQTYWDNSCGSLHKHETKSHAIIIPTTSAQPSPNPTYIVENMYLQF